MDAKNADELHKLFFRLRDEFGQTFVIVTHNKKLSKISDRIVKLVDGKLNLSEIKSFLDYKADLYENQNFIENDPISIPIFQKKRT